METRFIPRDLRALDGLSADLLACPFWSDVRPMRGLAGLIDWRLSGKIGELLRRRFITGEAGELLLVPIGWSGPIDKLIVFGAGERAHFDKNAFMQALGSVAHAMRNLKVRSVVIELPGRADHLVEVDTALEWSRQCADSGQANPTWSIVEDERWLSQEMRRR